MGVVYLAEDSTLSREIALKVLYPSLSTDTVFIERFKQEARVVANILHPNIVRVNSLETIDQSLAIDMEYVAGPSLGHTMAHEVFTPALAVQIARDTLEGLAVCHELGVVHRDIKPNNILLSPDGRAKLADFGLATAYAIHLESSIYRMSSSGFFLGTPRFAPPEAWEGGHPLPDWDLYSLGLVLYEGLIGKPVYNGSTPLAIVKQIMTDRVASVRDLVPHVSREMGQFIDRLISHNHSDRPVDASAALAELRALPEYQQTVGTDSPTVRTAVRTVHRKTVNARWKKLTRKAIVRGLIGAALLGSVSAAIWFAGEARTNRESNAAVPKPSPPVVTQEELGQTKLLTKDDVLSHPKTIATKSARIFDARYYKVGDNKDSGSSGVDHSERWLVSPLGNGMSFQIVGISERFLLVGELLASDASNVTLKGNWAAYSLPFGAGYQEGTIDGNGAWIVPEKAFNLQLRLENIRDHSVQVFSVAAACDEKLGLDSRFAYELESTPLLQPLIFTELMYRHAAWSDPVYDLLPSVYATICTAPMLGGVPPPQIDGDLTENVWTQQFFNKRGRIGDLPGRPMLAGAELKVRVMSEELFMALRVPKQEPKRWGVRLVLMPILAGPLPAQASMRIVRYKGQPIEYHHYQGGIERDWEHFDWKLELHGSQESVSCEISIPLNSLEARARPAEEVAWRLNAWLVEGENPLEETPIAVWGFPDLISVDHGALLRFEPYLSQ